MHPRCTSLTDSPCAILGLRRLMVGTHANSNPKRPIAAPRTPSPSRTATNRHVIPPKRKPRTDGALYGAVEHVEAMVLIVFIATGGNIDSGGGGDEDEDEEVDGWSRSFTAGIGGGLR